MAVVYVNIGSNLGEREELIELAVRKIKETFGSCKISGFIESQPWGYESINPFLNLGISFDSYLSPEEILEILQQIEKNISGVAHRKEDGSYKDREIDIDIMAIEDLVFKSSSLQLPHKFLKERYFFLKPLQDLNPKWVDPESNKNIDEIIKELRNRK